LFSKYGNISSFVTTGISGKGLSGNLGKGLSGHLGKDLLMLNSGFCQIFTSINDPLCLFQNRNNKLSSECDASSFNLLILNITFSNLSKLLFDPPSKGSNDEPLFCLLLLNRKGKIVFSKIRL
jgi:hypothetical protein